MTAELTRLWLAGRHSDHTLTDEGRANVPATVFDGNALGSVHG